MTKVDTADSASTMQHVELSTLSPTVSKNPASKTRLSALSGVPARVTVIAGQAASTVGELLNLKEGAVLTLDTALNAPFDIIINDTVIARGELVAVGDHFGICVTQVQNHPNSAIGKV